MPHPRTKLVKIPALWRMPACIVLACFMQALPAQSSIAPEKQFQAAVAAERSGDTATAERLYRGLLRTYPRALPARANLAGLLVGRGALDEAVAEYRTALKSAPHDSNLRTGLAYALGLRGRPGDLEAAIAELQPVHRDHPADEKAGLLLADAYVRQGRFPEALPLLENLEKEHPQDRDIAWLLGSALIRSGRLQDGLRRIDALAAADGSADAYLLAGEARLDLQQFDLAKADAEAALQREPQIAGGQALLGRALGHLGDYAGSEIALRKAVAASPGDLQAQFYLGALLQFQRNLPEAEQHLRRALALDPAFAEARYKIALIEDGSGDRQAAVRDLETVTRQRPAWLEPHSKLLALLYRLGRADEAAQLKVTVDRLKAAEPPPSPQQALP